ncbi:unnamed protein product [Pipistrellus nathusii]|uniref:Uncharacterized protein n=1 Tax=Pipistrellus nathusii TaxID=59473 RepID=A0ABN9ZIH7_PIPNA
MSGLCMWAPGFLLLQLLWLQVQAAPIPELPMDSFMLTSIPLGPTEPWSWNENQQIPIPADRKVTSLNTAVLTEAPEKTELPNSQKTSTQISSVNPKSQHPLLKAQPSDHQKAASSFPDWGKIHHQLLSITVDKVEMGIVIKPKPPTKNEPSATDKEVSFNPAKLPNQQETPHQPTVLQQTTAPTKHLEMELSYPKPLQALQTTLSEVPPVTEQIATMKICELCTCSAGTLSCIGFGSNQLTKVPVPEPSIYSGTFTVL